MFVLSAADFGEGLTYPPEPGATVASEARVRAWDRLDDSAVKAGTILGGTVEWLTESVEVPAGFKFLAQISTRLNFRGPLPDGVRQNNVSPWPRFHGRFDAPATGSGGKDFVKLLPARVLAQLEDLGPGLPLSRDQAISGRAALAVDRREERLCSSALWLRRACRVATDRTRSREKPDYGRQASIRRFPKDHRQCKQHPASSSPWGRRSVARALT